GHGSHSGIPARVISRPGRSALVEGDVANLGTQIDDIGRVPVARHRDVFVADGSRGGDLVGGAAWHGDVDGSGGSGDLDPGGRGGEREVHLPDLRCHRERPAAQAGAADLAGVGGDPCPGEAAVQDDVPGVGGYGQGGAWRQLDLVVHVAVA